MRILIVDDQARIRDIVRFTLEKMWPSDLEITEASDGHEALRTIQDDDVGFDLALVDLRMPRLDGIGFLKQLRALGPLKEIPVIILTAEAEAGTVAEAVRWGACDYIVKPFNQATLREKVSRSLSHTEARKNAETSVMLTAIATGGDSEKQAPFLMRLSPEVRKALARRGRTKAYESGTSILLPHQTCTSLHLVIQGEVEEERIEGSEPGTEEIRTVGDCFAENSFVSGEPVGTLVRARNEVEVLSINRLEIGVLVSKYPELGYALSGLVARRSRSRVRQTPAPAAPALAGNLQTMPIADLVQILHLCHKTGHLRLKKLTEEAGLYFESGELRHAWLGELAGEEAFFKIMTWQDAEFSFESGRRPDQVTIPQPTMSMLLEGARRVDELSRN